MPPETTVRRRRSLCVSALGLSLLLGAATGCGAKPSNTAGTPNPANVSKNPANVSKAKDDGDWAYREMIAGLKEGLEATKSIKDEASAKAANGKLKAAADKTQAGAHEIIAALGDGHKPSESQVKELDQSEKQLEVEDERINKLGPAVLSAAPAYSDSNWRPRSRHSTRG